MNAERRTVYDFLRLPHHHRVAVARALGAWPEGHAGSDREAHVAVFRAVRAAGLLGRLREEIDKVARPRVEDATPPPSCAPEEFGALAPYLHHTAACASGGLQGCTCGMTAALEAVMRLVKYPRAGEDDEDEDAAPCSVCGRGGFRFGERHSTCGRAVLEAEKRAHAEGYEKGRRDARAGTGE